MGRSCRRPSRDDVAFAVLRRYQIQGLFPKSKSRSKMDRMSAPIKPSTPDGSTRGGTSSRVRSVTSAWSSRMLLALAYRSIPSVGIQFHARDGHGRQPELFGDLRIDCGERGSGVDDESPAESLSLAEITGIAPWSLRA